MATLRRLPQLAVAAAAGVLLVGALESAACAGDEQVQWKARDTRAPVVSPHDGWARDAGFASRGGSSNSSVGLNWRAHWPMSAKPAPVVNASQLQRRAAADGRTNDVTTAVAESPSPEGRSSEVRRAAQLQPLDPLYDPFGDRVAQQSEASGEVQLDPALPMPDRVGNAPMPAEEPSLDPLPTQPNPMNGFAPEAQPMPEAMGRTPQLPRPFDKTYCEDPGNCYVEMKTLQQLGKSFLDITPDLEPNTADPDGARRMDYMSATRPRSWENRDHETVAQGRLVDFEDGRVIIESDDGERVRVPFDDLSNEDLCYVTAWWRLPQECTLGDEKFAGRNWVAMTWTWKASGLCHKPLYFEDYRLERYGHTAGPLLQPALSGAHFFLNIAILPYKMGINPPNECRYALGYYRPGSCAPWLLDPVPLSLRGAVYEMGAVAVGITGIP
jgi:hypothetical protein